jgi:hypothetical protein
VFELFKKYFLPEFSKDPYPVLFYSFGGNFLHSIAASRWVLNE